MQVEPSRNVVDIFNRLSSVRGHHPLRARSVRAATLLLTLFLLLSACALDYEEGRVAEEIAEEVPTTRLVNAEITAIREGTLVVTAGLLESYPKQERQILENLAFIERGPDGDLRLEGRASRAIHHLDTDNIELQGEIYFRSAVEEAAIESEFLYWDEEAQILRSEPDGTVRLSEEDGTAIEGGGFRVDVSRRRLFFETGVEGTIVNEQDETPAAATDNTEGSAAEGEEGSADVAP
ncbi:MAG: LPS export ABC transporter periplasmic protein LptC [Spirochaetaceae bacterium]